MRSIILALATILTLASAAYADASWTALDGDISCKAETVGNHSLEMVTGQRGTIISTGRHRTNTSVYEWRRTVDTKLPQGATEYSHPNIDLITPCGAARPKGV
jgi:hypothetical protein